MSKEINKKDKKPEYDYVRFYLSLKPEEGKKLKQYLDENYTTFTKFVRRAMNEIIDK